MTRYDNEDTSLQTSVSSYYIHLVATHDLHHKDGRTRCTIAKTIHGYETRAAREYRAKKFIEMKYLFDMVNKP